MHGRCAAQFCNLIHMMLDELGGKGNECFHFNNLALEIQHETIRYMKAVQISHQHHIYLTSAANDEKSFLIKVVFKHLHVTFWWYCIWLETSGLTMPLQVAFPNFRESQLEGIPTPQRSSQICLCVSLIRLSDLLSHEGPVSTRSAKVGDLLFLVPQLGNHRQLYSLVRVQGFANLWYMLLWGVAGGGSTTEKCYVSKLCALWDLQAPLSLSWSLIQKSWSVGQELGLTSNWLLLVILPRGYCVTWFLIVRPVEDSESILCFSFSRDSRATYTLTKSLF